MRRSIRLRLFAWLVIASLGASGATAAERVYLDPSGVVRWTADDREVALFGANYALPSSSDYRAAGYVRADRKKLIEQDMAHFARMGWDGLRLALWGDWENSDREGNLIVNDHLDLLDYLIHQAKQRGISMLFTPIHRHSALWPDGQDSDAVQGFAKFYPVEELGTNPAAIAAQQNYIRQILEHVNPYTGIALKDEPAIVFIELINEPHHHADDLPGSIRYINALVEAVRSTGCEKILFHNLSQDFRMLPAIAASRAQGFSFGWYPTALGARRTLTENYLRWADAYAPLRGELPPLPRIVYEFDSADMLAPTMYPAMVRAFREVGAQFATMFAYDMLATAPYNLGWQTHYLNLVYSPRKAVSAIIAAEAMRTLPRGQTYGAYPQNCTFGPFRVSYAEDLSEMVTAEKFYHANTTATPPPAPAQLRQVIGVGSSPIVRYPGRGSYFLEKIDDGRWRLEVYPDAMFVQDPFAQRLNYQTVSSRLVWREWPMQISLPDLGAAFSIAPLNTGNAHRAQAVAGTFPIQPGVYLLTREGLLELPALPERHGQIGFREFVCPPPTDLPVQVLSQPPTEVIVGEPWTFVVEVIDETAPAGVTLRFHLDGETRTVPMQPRGGFVFAAEIPAASSPGVLDLAVEVATRDDAPQPTTSAESPRWRIAVVEPLAPLPLLDAGRDARRLFTGRGESYLQRIAATDAERAFLRLQRPAANASRRHVISLPVKNTIADRRTALRSTQSLRLLARGQGPLLVTLVEQDGTGWSANVVVASSDWQSCVIPLADFRLSTAAKLPLGYPGSWNSELTPAASRGGATDRLQLAAVEHLQITVPAGELAPASNAGSIDLSTVELIFH